jgi:hypothetical protein
VFSVGYEVKFIHHLKEMQPLKESFRDCISFPSKFNVANTPSEGNGYISNVGFCTFSYQTEYPKLPPEKSRWQLTLLC